MEIAQVDAEPGTGHSPRINSLEYGVYDPENRLRGYLKWSFPPWAKQEFPVFGAENFRIRHFGD